MSRYDEVPAAAAAHAPPRSAPRRLHVGDPASAVRFDATPEGHHTRDGPDGTLVGVTIVNARWLLEQEGEIALTLPAQRVVAHDLDPMLAA